MLKSICTAGIGYCYQCYCIISNSRIRMLSMLCRRGIVDATAGIAEIPTPRTYGGGSGSSTLVGKLCIRVEQAYFRHQESSHRQTASHNCLRCRGAGTAFVVCNNQAYVKSICCSIGMYRVLIIRYWCAITKVPGPTV